MVFNQHPVLKKVYLREIRKISLNVKTFFADKFHSLLYYSNFDNGK